MMKKIYIEKGHRFNRVDEIESRLQGISDEYVFVENPEDANIIINNYPPAKLKDLKNLEWIQTSAVGVDAYIKKGVLNDGVILTNAVDIHSKEVAEHIFGLMVSMIKKQHLYRKNQIAHSWNDEAKVKEITKLKVCIVGFGNIGKALAKLLKPLGIYLIAVKRHTIEKPDYIDELYTTKDLTKAISDVDVVVSVLPGNKENEHLFTLDTFKAMRKDTILINAGRGNLYSEETLLTVLNEHIIQAIAADVFEKEPLDANSQLWDYDNLVITPHVAGFFHLDSAYEAYIALIRENLRRYINNEELKNIVSERE